MTRNKTKIIVLSVAVSTVLLIFIISYWNIISSSAPAHPEDYAIGLH